MSTLILNGKVILVTGAAGGFGRRSCAELARAGAWVIATDVDGDGAAATARQCEQLGGKASSFQHDVSSEGDWARVIAAVAVQTGGRLDGLVNNAGKMLSKPFLRTSVAELRQLHAINVESVWIGSQAAYPLLERTAKAQGGASIVNISSVFGQVGALAQSAYSATKGALTVLSKSMAAEFARSGSGVRVNSVHPGPGNTPLLANGLQELLKEGLVASPEQAAAMVLGLIPNGRLTEPEDIANAILFLCSDLSRQITGTELTVDGGYTAV